MRAAPLLPLLVLLLAGCGKGDREARMAAAMDAPEASAFKMPMGGMAAAAKAEMPLADGRTGTDQARTASMETPVAPRMVVRDAELTLRVKSVEGVERQVGGTARSVGGIVEASQGTDLAGPTPGMTITLRVPEARFDEALRRLEGLGTRLGKTIASEDVTAQAVDLDARVKSLRVQEEAYRAILAAARRIPDVLEIQEKLTGVRTEIERIVAGRRDLGDRAARSRIVVTLSQVAPPPAPLVAAPEPDWLGGTWGDATGALRAFGRTLASLGIWALAMLPIWLPILLVGVFLVRRGASARA